MKPIRVGVICDFREEGWHSMDLIADMLLEMLPVVSPQTIAATRFHNIPISQIVDAARLAKQ